MIDFLPKMTAEEFNTQYPVGTPVMYYSVKTSEHGVTTSTRTPAFDLGSGHVLVSLAGKAGGVSIDHLKVLK